MTRAVWKFPLPARWGRNVIRMPGGAIIRHVADQGARLWVWAEVDEDVAKGGKYRTEPYLVDRVIYLVETGSPIPEQCFASDRDGVADMGMAWRGVAGQEPGARFIGTAICNGGAYVLHAYEGET